MSTAIAMGSSTTSVPSNLAQLLQELTDTMSMSTSVDQLETTTMDVDANADVHMSDAVGTGTGIDAGNLLVALLRKYKFWPALQVKKFFSNPNLVLLHNTYKRIDVSHFQTLYDECRSVVLDMSSPDMADNVVVSYADQIPTTWCVEQYAVGMHPADQCYEAFEGTVITVYNYKDVWYFGTSTCPNVNSSRYFHPTHTHGMMLDDAIAAIMGVPPPPKVQGHMQGHAYGETKSQDLRTAFTYHLNKDRAYAFVLVHHENRHVMDYTARFGENYAKLVHVIMRDRKTQADIPINADTVPEFLYTAFVYPRLYASPIEAIQMQAGAGQGQYGFIVTRPSSSGKDKDKERFKVCPEAIVIREEFDLGNPNMWHNMLNVYVQNKPHYKIVDYQRDFCPTLEVPKNMRGQDIAPTYIIHTVICTMRDILYTNYRASTTYNRNSKKYYIQREVDAQFAKIIKFHMAQLRNIQVTMHDHSPITPQAVYHYLCHHQTIKNLRLLVKHFASVSASMVTTFPPRTIECFLHLDALLSISSSSSTSIST